MLVKLKKEEMNQYIDFAYTISLDLSKSCYPTYADGIKTKEDFIDVARSSFDKVNNEILLFYYKDLLAGWIHYYFIPEDNYFTCESFAVSHHMDVALEELLALVKNQFKGYDFYFGCSIKNIEAIHFLKSNSFEKIEESSVCLFHFDEYQIQEESSLIKRITKDNFSDFEQLHHPFDEEMYWDCKHIYEDIDHWYIYVLYLDDKPMAAIYFVCCKMLLEIFGVDFKNKTFDSYYFELLMKKVLNEGKKLGVKPIYYFAEKKEITALERLGYQHFDDYVCYSKTME
ncbi:MAG: hypothetical protein K2N64_07025 [Anaeroplasmataceae bacterium]|nr:hypothetical protein [Anaeroplasmataceae bacterium]